MVELQDRVGRGAEVEVYEFGPFELDQRTFELRRAGEAVHLERLAHDFLLYLVRHRDRVIPTSELLGQLWPDAVVTRGVLARAAHRTREALGDDASQPAWIATLRGRGYRFVGTVRERLADPDPGGLEGASGGAAEALARLSRDRYQRALELLDAGAKSALRRELLIGLGHSLRATGERAAAARVLRQAARLIQARHGRRDVRATS
jgi:DNA-binding winged helix-turn-helix (wHTH) protein